MDPIRKKRERDDNSELEDRSRQKVLKTEQSAIMLSQQYVCMLCIFSEKFGE